MNSLLLFLIDKIYRIIHIVLHYVFALVYGPHGRKVPPVEGPILQMSATELARLIRRRKLKSETVVRTFINRIIEVEPIINATVDCRFKEALAEAKEADSLVASGRMTVEQLEREKPLLGVPFSVKILLTVKGLRCTAGSLLFKNVRAQDDAHVVRQMTAAGAIVLVTTNSSEAGTSLETSNYVHGTTRNPYDTSRTSGGSSGGESALLSAAGSVIGLGNDMVGSIRVPCMFTSLFGHKPTRGVVSNSGIFPKPNLQLKRFLCTGPMCRYAEDLATMMKILALPTDKDIKFGEKVDFKSLKVYYLPTFGKIPLAEDVDMEIQDAVNKVASQFEILGSKVKQIDIPLLKQSFPIFIHTFFFSGSEVAALLTGGKTTVNGILELIKFLCFKSKFTLGVIFCLNFNRLPFLFNPKRVEFYKTLENQLDDQLTDLLDENSILIMPTFPCTAPYHRETPLLLGSSCYISAFNALGLPSTQCPVGLDKRGLPLGVQIISRRRNDHLTIACALEVEKAFGGWKPPCSWH